MMHGTVLGPVAMSKSTQKYPGMEEFEQLLADYEQGDLMESLADYVMRCFQEADTHKRSSGVEEDILRAMRAWASKYDPEDYANLGLGEGRDIYLPITNLKCRALRSWLHDILINAEDKPWTLGPTPDPELSPEAEEAVVEALMAELEENGMEADLSERVTYYKDLAMSHTMRLAARALTRMEAKIQDTMLEGGWRSAFADLASDISVYPTAFVRGPVMRRSPTLRWKGNALIPVDRIIYATERVHPLDVFPSPVSKTLQDGPYVIERRAMTKHNLMSAITIKGFKESAIRVVLDRSSAGVSLDLPSDAEREELESIDTEMVAPRATPSQTYDVLVYYGVVDGEMLLEHGVEVDDPQATYASEIWVCSGQVLKAALNPHPLGLRPLYGTSFEHIPESIWGRSLPSLIRDTQRIANASARSLVTNMAFASGPFGEYDVDRLASGSDINQLEPYRMYAVESDSLGAQQGAAIRLSKVTSVTAEMIAVMDRFMKVADDVSGIPSYVIGSPQVGGAGRTLGGLSLLMGNAAKGIKLVISNIDKQAIEPIVQAYYVVEMVYGQDQSLKVDAQVMARGSAGILQRELTQARAVEVLTMLTPYASARDAEGNSVVPLKGLQIVLRDVLRGLGYSADEVIPDPARRSQLEKLAGRINARKNQTQTGSQINPAAPLARLDGRSSTPADPTASSAIPAPR